MRIINLGILAHIDSGKTTTCEQLLHKSGVIRSAGTIENKNTHTDFLDIERQRGISVRSGNAVIEYKNTRINIIDTPGHMDFTGEVERALYAVDCVLLIISAAEGIQSQTEIFWKCIEDLKLPVIIFVNKIDRNGCNLENVYEQISKLSSGLFELNKAVDAGEKHCNVVEIDEFSEEQILSLCDMDSDLAEKFLSNKKINKSDIIASVSKNTLLCNCVPVLYGSAFFGTGIELLLNAIVTYMPTAENNENDELSGVIYKIEHESGMGKISHVRLFGGQIKNRDTLSLTHRAGGEPFFEKATQIRKIAGVNKKDTGLLTAGDIAAIYGLSNAKTGDIIGKMTQQHFYEIAAPLLSVKVTDGNPNPTQLIKAIGELCDEDPLLSYEWETSEREVLVKVMGDIQVETLEFLLKERYNINPAFSKPTVIYKETPSKSGKGFEAYTMPKPCWAVVELKIDPMPRGYGYSFESNVREMDIYTRYQNHVQASLQETLKQGILGWEVIDFKATLIGGQHHLIHTHPLDFFVATPIAFLRALTDACSQLLEPILNVRLTADNSFVSRIIGDITAMRGTFDSPVMSKGEVIVECELPLATSLEYPIKFASMTSGKGKIKSQLKGYAECPLELGQTTPRRGIDPLDRSKWILYRRHAIQDKT